IVQSQPARKRSLGGVPREQLLRSLLGTEQMELAETRVGLTHDSFEHPLDTRGEQGARELGAALADAQLRQPGLQAQREVRPSRGRSLTEHDGQRALASFIDWGRERSGDLARELTGGNPGARELVREAAEAP